MNFIILDLEATCWQGNDMDRRQEIIELAAWHVNGYGEWGESFQRFVRPTDHPRLSAYCTDLTGIRQDQVDSARKIGTVLEEFSLWLEDIPAPQLICTWGDKDMPIIYAECLRHDLEDDYFPKSIDLKAQYAEQQRLDKPVGLQKALAYNDIEFEGDPHRAIDDAYNTAVLFRLFLDRWQY